ncbi:hypothetical protein [Streptomyces sp. NPDC000878]
MPFQDYDEDVLLSELQILTAVQRRVFATACAEVLLLKFGSRSGVQSVSAESGRAVETCWSFVEHGSADSESADPLLMDLEEVLSLDDEGELGVVEHVIAGAFYALECSRSADAGQAELVAKNLYEAADYMALLDPGVDLRDRGVDRGIVESGLVQEVLSSIAWILSFVTANLFQGDGSSDELAQLRAFIEREMSE